MSDEKNNTDAWMEVLKLAKAMPREEQIRMLAATAAFLDIKDEVIDRLRRCPFCTQRLPR